MKDIFLIALGAFVAFGVVVSLFILSMFLASEYHII